MTSRRLAREGRLIDRNSPLSFRFDGTTYEGFRGDTLASALLANDVRVVGRSFKYHRPRGVMSLGAEEANALVEVGEGPLREPNSRATQIPLSEGLIAQSQNRWPSLAFDALGANDVFAPLLKAGFYYKSFKWPRAAWRFYEHYIRKAAGLGSPPRDADPAKYDARWHFADVLVIGAGPAGLAAAQAALRCGARVTLVEQEQVPGGFLCYDDFEIDGMGGDKWARRMANDIAASPRGTFLPNTTALGLYDHNFVSVVERLPALEPAHVGAPAQRLWKIRAKQIVVAAGAIERPLVVPGNDRPGVMLASAVRGYLNGYGVAAGSRVAVMTNNDDAYRTVRDLERAGIEVCAVVDTRTQAAPLADLLGSRVRPRHAISRVHGKTRVEAIEIRSLAGGPNIKIDCDLVCLSGGYTPSVHLYMHARGALRWSDEIAAFVPARPLPMVRSAGGCAGIFSLRDVLNSGSEAGLACAEAVGLRRDVLPAFAVEGGAALRIEPFWQLPPSWSRAEKAFVDLQNDVTEQDIAQSHDEGYVSLEHLKRYTTLGMGTDQGKTSNINGLALMAIAENRTVGAAGTTTYRPPYQPVTLGALAAGRTGPHVEPVRHTPLADRLAEDGAVFVNSGHWRRARFFPKGGETLSAAARREAMSVRIGVGMTEISTLGKFEISEPGAIDLLDRVYATPVRSLAIGSVRGGLMLREDGMAFDDGTLWRLGEDRYLVTASTANASAVLSHLEYVRDVVMREADVDIACVSEQWGGIAVTGPKSELVVNDLLAAWNIERGSPLGHQRFRAFEGTSVSLRMARISYSGERAYEIYVPANRAADAWTMLKRVGAAYGIVPYGLESLEYLRIEKGFLGCGHEISGRTTPDDLGVARMLKKTPNYLGAAGLQRPALRANGRFQLVGLVAQQDEIGEGAQLVRGKGSSAEPEGYVTSSGYSVHMSCGIALALLADGRARCGETLTAADPVRGRAQKVRVVSPVFYDPSGAALGR